MKLTTRLRQHWLSGGAGLDHRNARLGPIARHALIGAAISAIALPMTAPAKADDIGELKAEIRALNKRLTDMEEQKTKVKAMSDRLKQVEKKEEARAEAPPPGKPIPTKAGPWEAFTTGKPVHILETQNTDVLLYGIIEPTLGYTTNVDKAGHSTVGLNVSWFSGNRWGLFVTQKVFPEYGFNLLAKMESEFELPSGNMDTPGVLFNRDAWVGFESPELGRFSVGRQNTLPRDVANIWADPYGASKLSTGEGGFTNNNNFKQIIFYTSGGNGVNGQGDTRYDQGFVWKKIFDNGLYLGAAYNFGDGNGPGGPNGSGPIPGAGFDKGSTGAVAAGYNVGEFHVSGFYTAANVLEIPTIGTTNIGHTHQSWGIGGNWDGGLLRLNTGYMHYTADQGAILGTRNDDVVTVSAKVTPSKLYDVEVGWQDFFAHNAAISAAGYTLVPFKDATGAVATGTGTRMTTYASLIYHPISNVDVYIAGDHLKTTAGYSASQAHKHDTADEVVTGVRYKW